MLTRLNYIVFCLFLFACHSAEHAQNNKDNKNNSDTSIVTNTGDGSISIQLNYTGIVKDMSMNEGCGWMIELDLGNNQKQLLEPLSLDERFQVDGKEIRFTYTDSRRPSKCNLPSKPITIDTIFE